MQLTVKEIDNILAGEDIEGLIETGAPSDEYIHESAQIAAAVNLLSPSDRTINNILAIVGTLWVKSFGLASSDIELRASAIQRVAKKIFALTQG